MEFSLFAFTTQVLPEQYYTNDRAVEGVRMVVVGVAVSLVDVVVVADVCLSINTTGYGRSLFPRAALSALVLKL